jgi:hypothetical protein
MINFPSGSIRLKVTTEKNSVGLELENMITTKITKKSKERESKTYLKMQVIINTASKDQSGHVFIFKKCSVMGYINKC